MFSNFPHSHQHPLAMPVPGSDVPSRSTGGAVVVLTLVASLVGVGMSFGVTADSATAGLPVEAHGGHQHAAMAGLNAAGVISGSPVSAVREDLATARSATAAFHRVP